MLLKSTLRWVGEVTNKLSTPKLHFGASSGTRFPDTNHTGLVSRSRSHGFASLWKTKPATQNKWRKLLCNRARSSKGEINRGCGLKFYQTVSSQERGTMRGWSLQENPPGTSVQPSPALTQLVKTWKSEHREPRRAAGNLPSAWCAGDSCLCWEGCPPLSHSSTKSHLLH